MPRGRLGAHYRSPPVGRETAVPRRTARRRVCPPASRFGPAGRARRRRDRGAASRRDRVPALATWRAAPRCSTRARCSALTGTAEMRAKPVPSSSSSRRPSASTGFGHSFPPAAAACATDAPARSGAVRGLAVEDLVAQAGDVVHLRNDHAANQIAELAARRSSTGRRRARAGSWRGHVVFAPARSCPGRSAGRSPVEHAGQLPRQVHRIAQPGAHALPDERRGEVGGVAEQEDVAAPPAVGESAPGTCTR